MKNKFLLLLIAMCGALASCSNLFDTDTSAVIVDRGQHLNSPNDSLYSVMGILSQTQRLGERYVVLGELRSDLMSTTPEADVALKELCNHAATDSNPYADPTDFYSVVNNCNYAIERMDTTVAIYQTRVLVPEYVAIKVIRDWTLFQTALVYGETPWMDRPILSVEDATAHYAPIGIDDVAQRIIDDLTPHIGVRPLDYGTIDGFASARFFYPIEILVADMHLFLGHYEDAARLYTRYISDHRLTLTNGYANSWARDTRQQAYINHTGSYQGEMLCGIPFSSNLRDEHPALVRLTYNAAPAIVPSEQYLQQMEHAMFFYAEAGALSIGNYFEGDLRGQAQAVGGHVQPSSYGTQQLGTVTRPRIMKYINSAQLNETASDPQNTAVRGLYTTRIVPTLRTPHIYLRLAEALNRMGKPTLAFAILKYGLNYDTLENPDRIDPAELESTEGWLDFSWIRSSDGNANVGTASRGRGRGVALDTENYILPRIDAPWTETTVEDAEGNVTTVMTPPAADVEALETMILDELAAETAFEGNRFFDLLRVARHRGTTDGIWFLKRSK